MAKYVGKIFQVSNRILGLRGNRCHYVHVTWFNPKTKKFRCRIITSLEDVSVLSKSERKVLQTTPFIKSNETFFLFKKKKYKDLREGHVAPIPVGRTQGFDGWIGYTRSLDIERNHLQTSEATARMSIKK